MSKLKGNQTTRRDKLDRSYAIISALAHHLKASHQYEIDNKHYGEKDCSWCAEIKAAEVFLKLLDDDYEKKRRE
jgi:hypothetical protein